VTEGTSGAGLPTRAGAAARSWVTTSPARAGYAAVGLVLLVSWPFGGWEPADADPPTSTAPGAEVVAAPFTVSVDRAVAGVDLGPPFWPLDNGVNPDQADDQHLLLLLTVRNDSDRTLPVSEVFRGLVEVRGPAELVTTTGHPQAGVSAWSAVYTDHERPQPLAALGPGLEHQLLLHQPVSGEAPETVSVDLLQRTYRQSSLDDTMLWTDGTLRTTVTVPVETVDAPLFATAGEGDR
jgi:hypothetical protein